MINKLVVFGDSWPHGNELDRDPKTLSKRFPELIAKLLGAKCRNLSRPSTSFDGAVIEFLKNITNMTKPGTAVLFCITGTDRQLCFTDGKVNELHPQNTDQISLHYYTKIYSKDLGEYNRVRNVLLIQELCNRFEVPVFFVCNWNNIPQHDLIDQTRFVPQSMVEMLGGSNADVGRWNKGLLKYRMPQGHPNLLGHEKIATDIYNWIKENHDQSLS